MEIMEKILPHVITAVISLIGGYFALVQNLKTRVTVLERRIEELEVDISKQDQKLDKLADIITKMQIDIASIKTTLNIIHDNE